MPAQRFEYVVEVVAAHGGGQDRARVFERDDGIVIALADGAGGTANGAVAADAVVDAIGTAGADTNWSALLVDLDGDVKRLGGGQSTAVIISIRRTRLGGASVGDSGAWLISGSDVLDLTAGQARKPLVGGGCSPCDVAARALGDATLLVASDGLLRYAKQRDIARVSTAADLAAAAGALIDLVRLPRGGLQDDVSIVCAASSHSDRVSLYLARHAAASCAATKLRRGLKKFGEDIGVARAAFDRRHDG